jgi:hypothetical protein
LGSSRNATTFKVWEFGYCSFLNYFISESSNWLIVQVVEAWFVPWTMDNNGHDDKRLSRDWWGCASVNK